MWKPSSLSCEMGIVRHGELASPCRKSDRKILLVWQAKREFNFRYWLEAEFYPTGFEPVTSAFGGSQTEFKTF